MENFRVFIKKQPSMKLTKEQLKNIIKEEASRIRKEMELERVKSSKKIQLEGRKAEIESQLSEMYGEDVQEIFGLEKTKLGQAVGMKTPEQKNQAAVATITAHPVWKNAPAKWAQTYKITPEVAMQWLVDIVVAEGGKLPTSVKWDAAKNKMVNATTYSATGGSGGVNPTH